MCVCVCVCVRESVCARKTRNMSVKLSVCIWVCFAELKREDKLYLQHVYVYVYACVLVRMSFSANSPNRRVY